MSVNFDTIQNIIIILVLGVRNEREKRTYQ